MEQMKYAQECNRIVFVSYARSTLSMRAFIGQAEKILSKLDVDFLKPLENLNFIDETYAGSFTVYDDDCNLLIDCTKTPRGWRVGYIRATPQQLARIIDYMFKADLLYIPMCYKINDLLCRL